MTLRATRDAALINGALGWVTLSQARLGAQLADIREQTRGNYTHTAPPMQSLGYLWSLPDDPSSSAGLGGGIAWAWDSSLCGQLQDRFHEDAMLFEWIDCDMLKAALHRAFYSWSSNHPLIQFVDVTKECDALYEGLGPNCPLAELWVTALTPTRRALTTDDTTGADLEPVYAALSSHGTSQEEVGEDQSGGGRVAARASPTARYSTDFRWTSGIPAGGGSSAPIIETVKAVIAFNVDPSFCWYIDSFFCSRFHTLKQVGTPEAVLLGGRVITYTIWSAVLLLFLLLLAQGLRKHFRSADTPCTPRQLGRALLSIAASWSTVGTIQCCSWSRRQPSFTSSSSRALNALILRRPPRMRLVTFSAFHIQMRTWRDMCLMVRRLERMCITRASRRQRRVAMMMRRHSTRAPFAAIRGVVSRKACTAAAPR